MHDDEVKTHARRGFVRAAGGAVLGFAAGAAAGAGLAYQASPLPPLVDGPKRFAGKVVVVTGGTSGIGRASVLAFADAGAQVVFCGRREALGAELAALVTSRGGAARFVRCDVREEDQVTAFMDDVLAREGRLDVAFNNAGIQVAKPFHELSVADFDDMQATNVRGVFLCMRAQLPIMMAQGGGVIVLTSSVQELATRETMAGYGAGKRALVGLMRTAALEYARYGIRVNAICPGATDTPMVRPKGLPDAAWGIAAKQWAKANVHGMARMGTPDEMARAVLWMASDEMSYLTGASIVVDGGMTTAL